MRIHGIGLPAVAILLASVTFVMAEEPNVGELTRELKGEKPAAERTPEQLDAVCAKVLDALMPDMGNEDPGKCGGPQGTLEAIAFRASRPGAEAERAACSKAIAARLGPDVAPLARVWLLRQLERIGRAEAVPQIAGLLSDKDALVRESARRALRKNPAKEANDALQKALGSTDTAAWRVAVIEALADRRDASNLSLLLKEAASDSDDVRSAAVAGLAKIGDKSAVGPVAAAMSKGSPAARRVATDSYLLLADALADKGDTAAALGIYRKMLSSPGQLKCAAIIGIGRSGSASDLPTLFDAVADPDPKLRGACVEAMVLLKATDVTAAIAAKTKTAEPGMKPALLQALARRGDKSTRATFVASAEDADEAVRVEAIRGLGMVGDAAAVPLLLKIAATTGKPQEAARESLERVKGADVDKALLGAMDGKEPSIRVEVIRALSARRVAAATPGLLKSAEDADAGVRSESLKALGVVAPAGALPAVAALLVKTEDGAARSDAANALVSIAGREADVEKRSEPILKALESAGGPARLALLGVVGRLGGQKSLEAVRAAVKDNDEKVRDAAIRTLADWPDAAAAPDLLGIAKSAASETHQVLAIRGYVRVVRLQSGRPAAETARMLAAALAAAKRPDEKKQALGGLAEARHIGALEAVVPCLDDAALKEEATHAAVRIGREIVNDNPEAVKAAMQKVLEISKNADVQRQAKETLDRAEQKLKEAKPKK
jgi:HEAT repeat protein